MARRYKNVCMIMGITRLPIKIRSKWPKIQHREYSDIVIL